MSYAPDVRGVPAKSTGTAASVSPAFAAGLPEVRCASGTEGLSITELPADTILGSVLTIFPVLVRLKPLGEPLVTLDVP